MEKYILVTFFNGDRYEIPAKVVAENRAHYCAKFEDDDTEGEGKYNLIYDEEYEYAINNNFELKDWAECCMNWKDLEPYAKLVKREEIDLDLEWTSATKEVVEMRDLEPKEKKTS